MYQVPASRSSVVQFVMTCPGMSHSSTFTLHMRDSGEVDDGKVWGDLCRGKWVNIAYTIPLFDETGEMVKEPVDPINGVTHIPWDWEILESFIHNNDIVPVWIFSDFTSGVYDEESERWTGGVGKVSTSKLIIDISGLVNIIFIDSR